MSNLKEYVVVRRKTGALELQQTIFYNFWHKGNPDYIPVATFNADEDLKDGEIETLKAENGKMRKVLEEIQAKINRLIKEDTKGRAIEVAVIMANNVKEILSIATEALKTNSNE